MIDLTPTETVIAALVAQAKSDKEIARELGVKPSTVRCLLHRIYAKNFWASTSPRVALGIAWALSLQAQAAVPPEGMPVLPPDADDFALIVCGIALIAILLALREADRASVRKLAEELQDMRIHLGKSDQESK